MSPKAVQSFWPLLGLKGAEVIYTCLALRYVVAFALVALFLPVFGRDKAREHYAHKDKSKVPAETAQQTPTPPVNVINESSGRVEKTGSEVPPKGYISRLLAPENLPQIGLLLASVFGIGAAYRTLKAIERQTEHIARQARSMRYQTTHLRNSVEVAKASADAARLSTDRAAAVAIPTLRVESFYTAGIGNASLEAVLQFPKVTIVLKNHGQSPAFLRSWCLIFTCEDLPDIPVYAGPTCGMVFEKDVIQAGASYPLPDIGSWHRHKVSTEDIEAILQGEKVLRAYGYILYDDLFGNPVRRLKFCELVLNFSGFGIQWSTDWNATAYLGNDYLS